MNYGIWHADDVLNQLSLISKEDELYVEPFRHGTMSLGMYTPYRQDPQVPHEQDELYFVLSGSGMFVHGNDRSEFKTGDALFVAAGEEHRFEDFTDDFAAWVVFWSANGGEHEENIFEA
jgi:mannose-6-phosphate isomerase-like protein (cupin superfamily)